MKIYNTELVNISLNIYTSISGWVKNRFKVKQPEGIWKNNHMSIFFVKIYTKFISGILRCSHSDRCIYSKTEIQLRIGLKSVRSGDLSKWP